MKIIYLYLFLLISTCSNAQITLDHEIDSLDLDTGFKPVQISQNETKYYLADTVSNTFSLLNLDFTPFLTNIAVPEAFNSAQFGYQVLYITRSLFDCDSTNIEFVYSAPLDSKKPFRILRTDGTVLFFRDSINSTYCFGCRGGSDDIRPIVNTSSGAKLFLQTYNLGYSQIFVYSLCGSLPTESTDFISMNYKHSFVKIFPNPSSNILNFEINIPDNLQGSEFELVILDDKSNILKREKVNSSSLHSINVESYVNGVYFYSFCSKNKSYQNGKFIINK